MHRRPVSISVLGGCLSIGSAAMILIMIRLVFLSEDSLYKQADDGQSVMGSLPLFVGLAASLINFICAVNILDGANWARWVYTLTAIGMCIFQFEAFTVLNAIQWMGFAFRAIMIIFLFLPGANEFFRTEQL
jgi:hypothetical protein